MCARVRESSACLAVEVGSVNRELRASSRPCSESEAGAVRLVPKQGEGEELLLWDPLVEMRVLGA